MCRLHVSELGEIWLLKPEATNDLESAANTDPSVFDSHSVSNVLNSSKREMILPNVSDTTSRMNVDVSLVSRSALSSKLA